MEEVPDETKREGRGRESREVGERERSRVRHEDAFSRWGVNSAALRLPLSAASSCNHQHKAPLSILLRPPTLPAHNNRTLSRFSLSFSFFHSFALSSVYALLPLLSVLLSTMFLTLYESLSLRARRHCTPIETEISYVRLSKSLM